MSNRGQYFKNEEFLDSNGNGVECGRTANDPEKEDKIYTYDEALDLAGRGWYTYGLAAFLILAFQGLSLDMFGISVVLTGACDFNLTHYQKTILLSMPLIGSIVMAWPWGYIADTRGRRTALVVALWGSFILSTISAFSPNWIVLAVLKFGSCSLSSGTHSLGITLLGESCCQKLRSPFLILVTTSQVVVFGSYTVIGYLILNLNIWVDLDFIIFSNWRLLILVFALPLGLSAAFLPFIFESPKFLVNAGHEKEAVEILRNIMRRNGGDDTKYPVKKVVLKETSTLKLQNVPLWQSLRDQTLPLFKPPLLFSTIQMFYITAVIYSANNGFFVWMPFVMDSFYSGYNDNGTSGVCDMIVNSHKLDNDMETCVGTVKELVLWIAVIQSVVQITLNTGISLLSRWKKFILIGVLLFSFICGVLIPVVTDRMASIVLLNGFVMNSLCISIIFSYYVDLIPTSYRSEYDDEILEKLRELFKFYGILNAMAACLGVMVARSSSLAGSNLVGRYIDSHCFTSFYAWSIYVLSGAVASWFLPAVNTKTES